MNIIRSLREVAEGWYLALIVAVVAKETRKGRLSFLRCRITSGKYEGREGKLTRRDSLPGSIEEAIGQILCSMKVPASPRALADLSLSTHREVKRSHGLAVLRRGQFHKFLLHPRLQDWSVRLDRGHAAYGRLPYSGTQVFFGEFALIWCEEYENIARGTLTPMEAKTDAEQERLADEPVVEEEPEVEVDEPVAEEEPAPKGAPAVEEEPAIEEEPEPPAQDEPAGEEAAVERQRQEPARG